MGERIAFKEMAAFRPVTPGYALMPFRFARLPGRQEVLLTNEVGEFAFVADADLRALVAGTLDRGAPAYDELASRHFLAEGNPGAVTRMLAAKYRTRKSALRGGPALHLFVTSLRCDHSCAYCQVSRQSPDKSRYDMSPATARAAVDRMFEVASPALTVEFQGGEPLLAFDRIRQVTDLVLERNQAEKRDVSFVVTSTLHQLDAGMLAFFRQHGFKLSTSLDGPAWLHDANRPTPGRDGHARTLAGIALAREWLGDAQVAALTTLTRRSLDHPEAIVDHYVENSFRSVFLRPLSPYGFAVRAERRIGYGTADFLAFYRRAFAHILRLNREGTRIDEAYAAILLTHILSPFPTGYVDLRSPAGAGLGVLVYNYDGSVYASDEGRMLAEMGDTTFRLGSVHQPWQELAGSDAMATILGAGVAEALPGCADCAFLPYCGADPVHALATQGDPVGHRPTSAHCAKHTGIFQMLFDYLADGDPGTMRTFLSWVTHQDRDSLAGGAC